MTKEGENDTVKWVEQNSAEFSYAYDKKGDLARWFGVRGIPDAVLIDPFGTIVWRGHPMELQNATVEASLKGAIAAPLWDWPDDAKKARSALLKGSYAKALAEAEKVEGDFASVVQARITSLTEAVEGARAAGDILRTTELGERAAKELKGLPEAESLATMLKELKKDPEAKRILGGQKKLAQLSEEAADANGKKKLKKLIDSVQELRQEYADTIVAERAEGVVKSLTKKLSRI